MDEQQVHVLKAKTLQGAVQAGDGLAGALELTVELGGDEQFAAVHPAVPDSFAHPGLVAVLHRGVDVPVAERHGFLNGLRNLGVIQRPRAKAQLRDLVSVIEFYERG